MSPTARIIKKRLSHIQEKLTSNPDYIELMVLERILQEEESSGSIPQQSNNTRKRHNVMVGGYSYASKGKMIHIYDKIFAMVSQRGGRMLINDVKKELFEQNFLKQEDLKSVVAYIQHC